MTAKRPQSDTREDNSPNIPKTKVEISPEDAAKRDVKEVFGRYREQIREAVGKLTLSA